MKPRRRKCPICKQWFIPFPAELKVCPDPECAIAYARQEKAKAFDAETRRLKESIKTPTQLENELQTSVNRFIRARDYGKPCISCGRKTGAKMEAGHYRPKGGPNGVGALRFCEINIHLQCVQCNDHLAGHPFGFEQGLTQRIGRSLVEWLNAQSGDHELTNDDLRYLKRYYNTRAREAEKFNQQQSILDDTLPWELQA
jgi:hypothetical protein